MEGGGAYAPKPPHYPTMYASAKGLDHFASLAPLPWNQKLLKFRNLNDKSLPNNFKKYSSVKKNSVYIGGIQSKNNDRNLPLWCVCGPDERRLT